MAGHVDAWFKKTCDPHLFPALKNVSSCLLLTIGMMYSIIMIQVPKLNNVQPFPSTPRYPFLTNQSYPPPYPGENRHSQTRMSPSSLITRCNSPAQPTIAALMSIHQRMVQHAPTPHFQTSQPQPNPRSLGVSKAPTVSAIPWTHAMLR